MQRKFPINPVVATVFGVFHIGAFAAPFFYTPNRLLLALAVLAIVSSFGIGIGYHRLHTHRGFKTFRWFAYVLAVLGGLAQQGRAMVWVTFHNIHHAFTEQRGMDPHTPLDGGWWAHLDWMLHPDPQMKKTAQFMKWAPHLARDPFYKWPHMEWVPTTVLATLCLLFGGPAAVLWGVAVPVVIGWHQTWLVNSATHMWGTRRFNTGDDSRNNLLIALITWGEGWHNTHHKYAYSAQHGYAWWEIDVNWYIIWTLERLGLVWDVKTHHRLERQPQR